MNYATCHPDREHCARGMCDACYRRSRYKPGCRNAQLKDYYRDNRESLRSKRRARYAATHPNYIPRAERARLRSLKRATRPAAPNVIRPSIREWWKQEDKELPKHWQAPRMTRRQFLSEIRRAA